MAYWLLLVLGMVAAGIGLGWLFDGIYAGSTACFVLAILLVLLAIVTDRKRKKIL
jgi:hypothetical protein